MPLFVEFSHNTINNAIPYRCLETDKSSSNFFLPCEFRIFSLSSKHQIFRSELLLEVQLLSHSYFLLIHNVSEISSWVFKFSGSDFIFSTKLISYSQEMEMIALHNEQVAYISKEVLDEELFFSSISIRIYPSGRWPL